MQATIINAAPMAILRGTQDLSTRVLQRVPEDLPQHLPKFFIYAKKGPTKPMLVVGDSRTQMYDADSFDLRKKWANHATVFSNAVNAEGNSQMIERIVPADAGPAANLLLSLDVLATSIPVYQRNSDGSIKVDTNGVKLLVAGAGGSAPGYKVKWVVSTLATDALAENFGSATIVPGDQTDTDTATQSDRYPILQLKVSSQGAHGNDAGIRVWAPTNNTSSDVSNSLLTKELVYPFRVAVIRRPDVMSTPKIVETQFSEQYITVAAKPGTIDPVSDKPIYIADTLLDSFQNVTDPRFPAVVGDFGQLAFYQDNFDLLTQLFYTAEFANGYEENDFTGAADEQYLFNMIGGTSSNSAPYNTFQFVTGGTGTVRLSEFSNIFALSGSDGTMTDASFATSVAARMADYADSNNELSDTAINVESILYDSGFPLATKYALCNFIAARKDTFVVLSTHDVNQPDLTASEEYSLAIALRTRLQLFPESDYFGTPVMRGMIVGRSGKLSNSQFTKRVPASIEIAIKSARYMGAGDGKWKNGKAFDGAPGSILDYVSDLNVTFISATARNRNWDVGLNWVQAYDRRSLFFPALKTVYNDDTSVLNSYFTALAIGQINKVMEGIWRTFSGRSDLTNAQLVERVNTETTKRLLNRFDGRFVIVPEAYFTDSDLQRGYSWTVPVKIYAPNMMTVMTTSVHAFRIGDLVTA